MDQPSLFAEDPVQPAKREQATPAPVETWAGNDCHRCRCYTESSGHNTMPGFGNCSHMGKWEYVSTGPYSACKFHPSRLEL